MHNSKLAIIGAGPVGLRTAMSLKSKGLSYDQFERNEDVGGNWLNGVYETAHVISSKKTTEFPDWPMPAHYPDFPSGKQMITYMRDYTHYHNLRPSIAFRTEVSFAEPIKGGEQWRLIIKHLDTNQEEERIYQQLIVCNGHHWDMRWPDYPGKFTGEMIHSKQYKNSEILKGKRVLIIGAGNSGCDIAVEAARFAKCSHISMRRGYWFMPKSMLGLPSPDLLRWWLPVSIQKFLLKTIMLPLVIGKYTLYGLEKPIEPLFSRHPTLNDTLMYGFKHGTIKPKKDVKCFDGNIVEFVDGTREEYDLIVAATGFHYTLPFLRQDVIKWKKGFPDLISGVYSPTYKGFYLVGLAQPRSGLSLAAHFAETMVAMVLAQPKMQYPIGAVLAKLGFEPLKTYFFDHYYLVRRSWLMQKLAPWLPTLEKLLFHSEKKSGLVNEESAT